MGADFCESTCGGVRCDELIGIGDPDPHSRIAGKAKHWAVVADGFFAIWYDGWLEPNCTGPTAEGVAALGFILRRIGFGCEAAWEARARWPRNAWFAPCESVLVTHELDLGCAIVTHHGEPSSCPLCHPELATPSEEVSHA